MQILTQEKDIASEKEELKELNMGQETATREESEWPEGNSRVIPKGISNHLKMTHVKWSSKK